MDDNTDRIKELEAQVSELLPWALLGALAAHEDREDIARYVSLGTRVVPLRAGKARVLMARIKENEFGGVS